MDIFDADMIVFVPDTIGIPKIRTKDEIRYPPCWLIRGELMVKFPDIVPEIIKAIIVRADPGTCHILTTMHCKAVNMTDI